MSSGTGTIEDNFDGRTQVLFKQAKLASLKALGIMMSNNLSKNCLTSALVATRIFKAVGIPYSVVVGFVHLEGVAVSFPHVWLESPGGLVTDLAFSGPLRTVHVLGQSFGFSEEAVKPSFSATALFEPLNTSLSVEVIRKHAADLETYLQNGPPSVRSRVEDVLVKAMDGTDRVEFSGIAMDLLNSETQFAPATTTASGTPQVDGPAVDSVMPQ